MNNEPVAWRWKYVDENGEPFTKWQYWHEKPTIPKKDKKYLEPLYTHPHSEESVKVKTLTDKEINELAENTLPNQAIGFVPSWQWIEFARAILRKAQ